MALGFGFNKVKVMAAAEKYVQQGKLSNAVSEYEKVVKEDPNDLTVLNTIGDLQSRLGQNDKAAEYFKRVGEAYAKNGFTVKAIAMYKKLTKLAPNVTETLLRLAELYTIQGLYNDARGQYVHVADAYLKAGNNDDAAKVFQKILELDPDNAAMQTKLADLYIKLGKKSEARNIFFTAAQSLYAKQSMDASAEALEQVLILDPKNVDALLLRGTIAAEAGDGALALQYLGQIPDPDKNPDALRAMLRAQLLQKNYDEAKSIVSKLVTTHNDTTGVGWYADTLLAAGEFANGMEVYDAFGDQVLAANQAGALKFLNAAISRVRDNPASLEVVRRLFKKAGDNSHEAEIMEMLGHAYAHDNELQKAKAIYKQLAENEPDNPLHEQNYKQIVQRLGEDVAAAPLTAEQGAQALMIEEMDHKAPIIHQNYPADVEAAVQSAIADSELFDSYNLPAKAVAPLEKGLAQAPRDFQINLRLSTLYPKMNRFADAARSCKILSELYATEGNSGESQKYSDLSAKYLALAPELPPAEAPAAAPEPSAPAAAEFSMDVPVHAEEPSVEMLNLAPPAAAEPPPAERSGSHELDMNQWESMLSVDSSAPVQAAATEAPISMEVTGEVSPPAMEMPVEAAPIEMSVEPAAIEMPVEPATFDLAPPAPEAPAVAEFGFESVSPVEEAPAAIEPEPELAPPPPPVVQAPPPAAKAPPAATASAAAPAKPAEDEELDLLGDLVSGLEDSLGDDFAFGGKTGPKAAPKSAPRAAPAPPPPPAVSAPPVATASAAVEDVEPEEIAVPAPVAPESVPAGFSSMGHELPTQAPAIAKQEATSALSDMFSEFKEDAEESAGQAEDPDTHYNLGIAFKEMGLLDEAIGELQKVCHAIESGHPFDQSMQAYTWLAQCLVDKGVPQAAVRWYEKALKVNGINEDSRLAVYYDLGNAYEAAGNQKKAYETFMEVYSSNIDYRDVADRIKTLKA